MNSDYVLFVFAIFLGCVLLGVSFEGHELAHEVLVYIHDSCVVIKVSTVVLGREYGHELFVLSEETVTIFHDLVTSANQI